MNDLISAQNVLARSDASDAPVISICTTCRSQNATAEVVGPTLLAAVRDVVSSGDSIAVRAVQCLGVCKRPTTAAVSGPDRYTFVFADLQPADGATALRDFALSYARSDYGLVPWRERAQVLRRGMIARIPPTIWSPESGEPPK